MPNSILLQAIKEAYASNPSNTVILNTLEIRHPLFLDENGVSLPAFRITTEADDFTATLEADAPLNPSTAVLFRSYPFIFTLPKIDENTGIDLAVQIDNVDRLMIDNIKRATYSKIPIMMTYRPYLSTDLSQPQHSPLSHLPLVDVKADVLTITGKARFVNLANKSFPSELYTTTRFPALAR